MIVRNLLGFTGVVCFLLLAGCTSLPATEFSAYRNAFDAARTAGEQVTLDYGAAVAENKLRRSQVAASTRPAPLSSNSKTTFSVAAVMESSSVSGDVAERLRAWQVVADFNEALVSIAEGKSSRDLDAA